MDSDERATIVAIVVTKDRLDVLKVTIDHLLKEDIEHIFVFDNASQDGTWDWLNSLTDPRVRLLRSSENIGGAGGFSRSLAYCLNEIDPDWYVIMDDDARPRGCAIQKFRSLKPTGYDIIASAVYHPNGAISELNRPSRNPFWSINLFAKMALGCGRKGFHLSDQQYWQDECVEIDAASFVGLFISRNVLKKIGLPDERLFIYGDDTVFTLKSRRAGLKSIFMPAVHFEHDHEIIAPQLIIRPLWKVYYLCRNGIIVAREAAGVLGLPLAILWYLCAWVRKSYHYSSKERKLYFRFLIRGMCDGFSGRLGRNDKVMQQYFHHEGRIGSEINSSMVQNESDRHKGPGHSLSSANK